MLSVYVSLLSGAQRCLPEELLSDYRRKKLERLRNPLLRRQSVASELLLRHALRDCGFSVDEPLSITAGNHGKPALTSGICHFSISHSDHAILCALSYQELGADIQRRSKLHDAIIKRHFTQEEKNYILSSDDPSSAFTRVWTMKESYCKYTGEGLQLPLSSFSVFDPLLAPSFHLFAVEEYAVSVFCPGEAALNPRFSLVDENALCD